MTWYDKIKFITTKEDNSPELKKGEIKPILIDSFHKHLSEFKFVNYKNSQYNFQRTKEYKGFTVSETLHVLFSLNDKNFSCTVSSRLNKDYLNSKSYNTGLINPHIDLITLKKGTGVIKIEEAYYFHNGKIQTTTKLIEQICKDFAEYGVPFLNKQFNRLKTSQIVNTGLDYIKQLQLNRQEVKSQINNELKQVGYVVSRLTNFIYVDLKETLQKVPNQTKEDRQKIPGLAYELLELLWTDQ